MTTDKNPTKAGKPSFTPASSNDVGGVPMGAPSGGKGGTPSMGKNSIAPFGVAAGSKEKPDAIGSLTGAGNHVGGTNKAK